MDINKECNELIVRVIKGYAPTMMDFEKEFVTRRNMFMYKKLQLPFTTATLLWMALIFHFSSQPATQSGKLSIGVTRELVIAVEKMGLLKSGTNTNTVLISSLDDLVRSSGHFSEYLILGILVYALFRTFAMINKFRVIAAFIFCALYAISDEIHQYFVPGRAMQLSDFLVDCAGTLVGIGAFYVLSKLVSKEIIRYRSE